MIWNTITVCAEISFWLSLLGLAHTYLLYPLCIVCAAQLAKQGRRPVETRQELATDLPSVTVLIAVYNGAKHIRARIENLLANDYPRDRLQILIASDGSTDDTVAIAKSIQASNVRCIAFPSRAGKAATLVRAMPFIQSDIVLFSDASTRFSTNSISAIANRFTDPVVGIVSGQVRMLDGSGASSEGVYWRLETVVRRAEAELGIVTGVSGAIYAIRKCWFVAPKAATTNDDMVFPILSKHHHSCEFVYEPRAVAEVTLPSGAYDEFHRRRRIGCGAFQSLILLAPALSPWCGVSAWSLFSHKVLRWFGPFALIIALASNIVLIAELQYRLFLGLQILGYSIAFLGWRFPASHGWLRVARIAASFVEMNIAIFLGFVDWVVGAGKVTWEPTLRPERSVPRA